MSVPYPKHLTSMTAKIVLHGHAKIVPLDLFNHAKIILLKPTRVG